MTTATTKSVTVVTPWFANLGGSFNKTLQLMSGRMVGGENQEVASLDDLNRIATEKGVDQVMFGAAWMPRRAVKVADVTERMMHRLFFGPTKKPATPVYMSALPRFTADDLRDLGEI